MLGEGDGQRGVLGDHVRLGDGGRLGQPVAPVVGQARAVRAELADRRDERGGFQTRKVVPPGQAGPDELRRQGGQIGEGVSERAHVSQRGLLDVFVLRFQLVELLGDLVELRHGVGDLNPLIGDDRHPLRERRQVGDAEDRVYARRPHERGE